jgi:2-polyprenyl-3-methyl-5-hydroxy-6-metoxy-1,4-benzoquinol methylase
MMHGSRWWVVVILAVLQACTGRSGEPGTGLVTDTVAVLDDWPTDDTLRHLTQRFGDPERNLWQQPEVVLRKLGDLRTLTVADIGAGRGYFALPLAALSARTIAIDVDSGFVEYLRNQAAVNGFQNLEIRLTNPTDPALQPQEVDVVFVANTYRFLPQRTAYLRKVRQGLKPGGTVWVLDFLPGPLAQGPPEHEKIAPAEVERELRAAGFTTIVTDTVSLQYHYLVQAR